MNWIEACCQVVAAKSKSFVADLRAVSTVEYALMVVAVIAAVGGVAALLAGAFNDMFTDLSTELGSAVTSVTT